VIYVLVHARWHGAWCWDRVAARLRDAGHTVLAPDRADLTQVRDLVAEQDEPVVLVGHSSAGMIISAVAELVPHRVRLLVYVAAFLLPPGMLPPDIAREDDGSVLGRYLVVDGDTVSVARPAEVFFHDCDPADAAWASERLVAEPVIPPGGPAVSPTGARFGRVPRAYVECLRDRALGPAAQRRMYTLSPCRSVHSLPTGHAPFLSAPDRLASILRSAPVDLDLG
jgi:pimeloyl-ACP methyl ester carboxylesterase